MNDQTSDRRRQNELTLNLDEIVSTQPELGPSAPEGGYGWIVFIANLFFQALVPCLIVNLGVLVAFSKLGTTEDKNVLLWDGRFGKILYVPLFFCISKTIFDPFSRQIQNTTTTPRLIAVVGTCLTCAGLLFMWMGMTANEDDWLFLPAGLTSGMGSTILLNQCGTLVGQYFRLKNPVLSHISQTVAILGYVVAPIILGHNIFLTNISHVLLWYQAIILQGLIASLFFKKPEYLKSKNRKPYEFVLSNPDDEEDVLSKNSRELQIKRQTSTETHVSKIPIEPQPEASTSRQEGLVTIHKDHIGNPQGTSSQWETFEDEDINYAKLSNWETFEDDAQSSPRIINNLSLSEETNTQASIQPSSLFADFPVNNNNSYAYDDEISADVSNYNVFAPNSRNQSSFTRHFEVLKELTFYKSLLTMIANTYSYFVFFTLYPSYLYIESGSGHLEHMTQLVGTISVINLVFIFIAFCFKIDTKKRPVLLCIFYWTGSIGYFMIADFTNKSLLLVGGVQVVLSIQALEYISKPVFKLPANGVTSSENLMLCILSSLSLFVFLFIDVTVKTCFRMVAILDFFLGTLWLVNFAYKRKRIP